MSFSKAFDNVDHFLLSEKLKALNMNPYLTNWYLSFLKGRKQRLVFRGKAFNWLDQGTRQGSVSGPYLFNLFINDLCIKNSCMTHLIKYADDTTIQVNVSKLPDESRDTVNQYFEWSDDNCMQCNLKKCKELYLQKKCKTNCSNAQIDQITQVDSLKILGVTFQSNCRFTEHVRSKLVEANKCLFVIRSLRKEGYNQADKDHLFASIVLPKIT